MSFPSYLAEGASRPGYIAAVSELHGPLRFDYRPVLVAERLVLGELARTATSDVFVSEVATRLATRLVTWDLEASPGQPLRVEPAAIERLHPELFIRLYQIVFGYVGSDVDPQWPDELSQAELADQQEAAARGISVGELVEERNSKNWCWG